MSTGPSSAGAAPTGPFVSPAAGFAPRWSAEQDAVLDRALRRAEAAQTTVLLVEGATGTGKTTFLRRVAAEANGYFRLTLRAEPEGQQPYAALAEWSDDDALPDPKLTALQAAKLLHSRIEQIRPDAPVLIMVDDIQALDTESSDMIACLVERTMSDRLLVVVSADALTRPALGHWNRLKLDNDRAIHLELTGLAESMATDLIRTAWPDADTALCTRLREHTEGNPLLLQSLLHDHTLDEVRDIDELPAPHNLAHILTARMAPLDADGVAMLRAAVVLGNQWSALSTVCALAGLDTPTDAPDRLESQGLLRSRSALDRTEIRIIDGVIRIIIDGTIPPAERRALHLRAATLIDAPVDKLWHRYRATDGYDDDLANELDEASWSLHLARDYKQASQVGMWASNITSDAVVREKRLLDALFDAVLARDLDSVERRLARIGQVHDQARRKVVEAFLLARRWRCAAAAAVLLAIAPAFIEATDQRTQLRLHLINAWTQVAIGGPFDRAREALAAAMELGPMSDPCLSEYYSIVSGLVHNAGPLPPVVGGLDLGNVGHGADAALFGLPDLAIRHLKPFTTQLDDGVVTTMTDGEYHAMLGYAYWLRGDWAQARDRIATGLAFGSGAVNPMVRAVCVLADMAAGNPTTFARQQADAHAALWECPFPPAITMAVTAEFVCLRLTGRRTDRYLETANVDLGTYTWPTAQPTLWHLTLGQIH
ncbi:MAG: AAA family ATPase, partial [Mycobacterium sp.]|nr:AAA family ATPase [Mycobacterium sp.]